MTMQPNSPDHDANGSPVPSFQDEMMFMPSKSIWDPIEEDYGVEMVLGGNNTAASSIGDTATVSTMGGSSYISFSSSGRRRRRRRRHRHPSELDDVELRIQLWDCYRLARIILGIPIRSFQLSSKTILHAIQLVAEMKMELIQSRKDLEMAHAVVGRSSNTPSSHLPVVQHQESGTPKRTSPKKNPLEDMVLLYNPEVEEALEEQKMMYRTLMEEHENMIAATKEDIQTLASQFASSQSSGSTSAPATAGGDGRTEALFATLLSKIDETSEETKAKLLKLEETIETARQGDDDHHRSKDVCHSTQVNELQRRIRTNQTLHTLELETSKAKHMQQIVDISGQLEGYTEQVKSQQKELQEWKSKYQKLEALAVTPTEATTVLEAMENLKNRGDDVSRAEQNDVQEQMMTTLRRLSVLQTRQNEERSQLEKTVHTALTRKAKSKADLACLQLQMEMLKEETDQGVALDLRGQLAKQREDYQKQISDILRGEERRLVEMESLEVRLAELAFLAVELEDLVILKEQQDCEQQAAVQKLLDRQKSTGITLDDLKSQAQSLVESQKTTLKHLSAEKNLAEYEMKLEALHSEVAELSEKEKLEEELRKTRDELQSSRRRIQELEEQVGKGRGSPGSGSGGGGGSKKKQGPMRSQ